MRPTVIACLVALLLALSVGASVAPAPEVATASDAVRYRASGPLTLVAPATAKVRGRIAFTGRVRVKAGKPRRVAILEKVGGRWKVRTHARSNRKGAFAARLTAASSARTQVFRASASATHGLRSVRSPAVRVTVTTTATARVEANDWTYLFTGGSRWDPCEPITWSYDATGQVYAAARTDVTTAFANIAAASGLTFTYVSTGGDITVSWATAATVPRLAGNVVGIGGGEAFSTPPGADVRWRIHSGYLTLDRGAAFIDPGYGHSGWGQVMTHEILHALGLGHARWFDTQLMWSTASDKNYRFGLGDRTGMRKIGTAAGCL